jgi:hypothetical protein
LARSRRYALRIGLVEDVRASVDATVRATGEERGASNGALQFGEVTTAFAQIAGAGETESSSTQVLQTSSRLSTLSRELARIIRPQAGA